MPNPTLAREPVRPTLRSTFQVLHQLLIPSLQPQPPPNIDSAVAMVMTMQTARKHRACNPAPPLKPGHMMNASRTAMFRNGPVSARPTPARLASRSQHNSTLPLLSVLPLEVRTMIYKEVLGNKDIEIYGDINVTDGTGDRRGYVESDFALLLSCRQIYCESEDLLYLANEFIFDCRLYRDDWVADRTPQQLAAVRLDKTHNAHIFDSINMSGLGGCQTYCGGWCNGISKFTAPFSMLFPNVKRIGISVSRDMGQWPFTDIKRLGEKVGMSDWTGFVKIKERDSVEVAVVWPIEEM